MNEMTLTWTDANQVRTQTIREYQPSKSPGTVRIGRDPVRCDIVLTDPTVSGLHVEIFFNPQLCGFYLRNLRQSNPPLINGKILAQGDVVLSQGSTIYLGKQELRVIFISLAVFNISPTILIPPSTPRVPAATVTYGLQCSSCNRISTYNQLNFGCPWCGTSLAAAVSILMNPNGN